MDVTNGNGEVLDFDAAVMLMDDDIREELNKQDFQSEQDFFTAYENAHAGKYGEWELSKSNPVW